MLCEYNPLGCGSQGNAHITFPLTQCEARHYAQLWFTGTPQLTLAEWRDNLCRAHCTGLPNYMERAQVFNGAFAEELARIVAGMPAVEAADRPKYQKTLTALFMAPQGVTVRPSRYQSLNADGLWTELRPAYAVSVNYADRKGVHHE